MVKLTVNFINETKVSISESLVENTLKLILRRLGRLGRVDVELLVVEDPKIKELNTKYRNDQQATDVLSFPNLETSVGKDKLTGSIVISVDTAQKQAQQAGVTLESELQTLAGHGLLHLLDFHHR